MRKNTLHRHFKTFSLFKKRRTKQSKMTYSIGGDGIIADNLTYSVGREGILVDYLADDENILQPPSPAQVLREIMVDYKCDGGKVQAQIDANKEAAWIGYKELRAKLRGLKEDGLLDVNNATTKRIEAEKNDDKKQELITKMSLRHKEYLKELEQKIIKYVYLLDICDKVFERFQQIKKR